MGELERYVRGHKIERHLAGQREQTHAQKVAPLVVRVGIALGDAEREDGHRQAAESPHPHLAGEEVVAHVVEHHRRHGDQLEGGAIENLEAFGHFHGRFRSLLLRRLPNEQTL